MRCLKAPARPPPGAGEEPELAALENVESKKPSPKSTTSTTAYPELLTITNNSSSPS